MSPKLSSAAKKLTKEQKHEKSLENTVEKLTQNRNKEVNNKSNPNSISSVMDNKENGEAENRLYAKESKIEPDMLFHGEGCMSQGSLQGSSYETDPARTQNSTTKDNALKVNLIEKQKPECSKVKQDSSKNVGNFSKQDNSNKNESHLNHVEFTPDKNSVSNASDKLEYVGLESSNTTDNNNETFKQDNGVRQFNENGAKHENLSNSVKAVNNSDNSNSDVILKGVE